MAVSIAALRAMAEAGATVEMIINVIEADQIAEQKARKTKRKKDAERKRRARSDSTLELLQLDQDDTTMSAASSGQGVCPADIADTEQELVEVEEYQPPNLESEEMDPTKQKEIPPTPPKEKYNNIYPPDSARARGFRLPGEWRPTDADLTFAQSLLPSAAIIHTEIEKFRDYWHARAGPGAVKRDWSATWRNWCRKAAENGHATARQGGGRSAAPWQRRDDKKFEALDGLRAFNQSIADGEEGGESGATVVRLVPNAGRG